MSQLKTAVPSLVRSSSAIITSNFRSVPRNKKAAWGNRFVRDHYDLIYDANPESMSNRLKKRLSSKQEAVKKGEKEFFPAEKYKYVPFKERGQAKTTPSTGQLNGGLSPQEYLNDIKMFQSNLRQGAQTAQGIKGEGRGTKDFRIIGKEQGTSRQEEERPQQNHNSFGLSAFQYNKTIEGKTELRLNHHIDFTKNRTCKINNLNKIWYDDRLDLAGIHLKPTNSLNRIHSFKSDSPHQLFSQNKGANDDNSSGRGGMLDHFYDTLQTYTKYNEHSLGHPVQYQVMTGRFKRHQPEGAHLHYETTEFKTMRKGNGKRPIMEISKSKKQLVFKRQVIDPKRGCFR